MRTYSPIKLKDIIRIQQFYAVEYYESSKEFHLEKEAHDFWELTYVDNGVLQCIVDKESIQIKQGELLLIPPNTDHQYQNENGKPVTLLFLCFSARSPILKTLQGKHKLSSELTEILLKMIAEIRSTFTFTFRSDIHFIDTPEIGGQQLMQNYLVELFVKLSRSLRGAPNPQYLLYSTDSNNALVNKILSYLKSNVYGTFHLDTLSDKLFYSKAYLNRIFKQHIGSSIKNYYNFLKVKEAKRLLRSDKKMTANQVAKQLQFDDLSYFVKVFKKYTNLTPNEYKKKIL
jgi:AraC-like DNA-binding protein